MHRDNRSEVAHDMSLSVSDNNDHSASRLDPLTSSSISDHSPLSQGTSSTQDPHLITPNSYGVSQMLSAHNDTQLEVILPLSCSISSNLGELSNTSIHPMITRLKSGTIPHRSYKGYLATLPELQSLQLTEDTTFDGGFSVLVVNSDVAKPSTFRKVATMPQWQSVMQEEYDSLKAQGTWELVPHLMIGLLLAANRCTK
ncbi:hypothetical protein ACFX15_018842 [Malus domestica]